jgi:serine protease SohB
VREFLTQYGVFLAETLTILFAAIVFLIVLAALRSRSKHKNDGELHLKKLNDHLDDVKTQLNSATLSKVANKRFLKDLKKSQKKANKAEQSTGKRIFLLNFAGDIKASSVASLREEITALLMIATDKDEVVVKVESGGGMMHAYGLAASQLARIRARHIFLTIAIDKVAASGGYMMAAVANKIIAAPFAIVGSIGVVAQLPNFSRLLEKHDVDYEIITAGEHKRTLTVFGKNTEKAREKFKQDIEEAHQLFKDFIIENRPGVDIAKVATGEHWFATSALKLNLVDELITSDDYLLKASETVDIYQINYLTKKSLLEKFSHMAEASVTALLPKKLFIRE